MDIRETVIYDYEVTVNNFHKLYDLQENFKLALEGDANSESLMAAIGDAATLASEFYSVVGTISTWVGGFFKMLNYVLDADRRMLAANAKNGYKSLLYLKNRFFAVNNPNKAEAARLDIVKTIFVVNGVSYSIISAVTLKAIKQNGVWVSR